MTTLTIEERAKAKVEQQGWKFIESKKASHPADHYIIYVIVERENKYTESGIDYATLLFNGDVNGLAYGHYDIPTLEKARADLARR